MRARSAVDRTIPDTLLYPYSAVPIVALDRAISTTTDMNEGDSSCNIEVDPDLATVRPQAAARRHAAARPAG